MREACAHQRILVVDDEPGLLVLSEVFSSEGYVVEMVGDRLQALDKARSFRPDLVLTNQHMPHGSGFDLAEDLLREGIKTRLVLHTDSGRGVTAAGCNERGFCDVLVKPTHVEEFLETVRRRLDDPDATNLRWRERATGTITS